MSEEPFKVHKTSSTYWIQEKNLLKWLGVALIPFGLATIIVLFSDTIAIWLPSLSMYQCGDWTEIYHGNAVESYENAVNIAIVVLSNYEFIVCTVFFACIFWLRHIHDEFNVNEELRRVSLTLFICDAFYFTSLMFLYNTPFVVLGFVQYFQIANSLILLQFTARNIRRSYEPNSIIPFPLTLESVQQLESALMMPTSCQIFYDFINDLGDVKGITLIAMYADLRVF